MSASRVPFVEFLRRLLAAGGAALVLALTVFAASPTLHEQLHCATDTHHDDSCPVVLLANSADVPVAAVSAPLPPVTWISAAPIATVQLYLTPPRYLRQPERGPPSNLLS